jgi:hypothetical protein
LGWIRNVPWSFNSLERAWTGTFQRRTHSHLGNGEKRDFSSTGSLGRRKQETLGILESQGLTSVKMIPPRPTFGDMTAPWIRIDLTSTQGVAIIMTPWDTWISGQEERVAAFFEKSKDQWLPPDETIE